MIFKQNLKPELFLKFGFHGCTPIEIISQTEEKENYLTKSEFISLLINHMKISNKK